MGLLARFRRPGGLEKLVALIEGADAKTKENLIKSIREEDPEYAKVVEERIFNWSDLFMLDDMTLSDILNTVHPKTLALALCFVDDGQKQYLLGRLNHIAAMRIHEEIDILGDKAEKGMVATARRKVIETARQLEQSGKFVLKKTAG
jgi:flagellar motor switch protein FliG